MAGLPFFVIPFCVSSFPVLVKERGFFLFFSPVFKENAFALILCLAFLAITWISKMHFNIKGAH